MITINDTKKFENKTSYPILTSPRSIDACARLGILQQDLCIKNPDDIKELYGTEVRSDEIGYALEYNENKRKDQIRRIKAERKKII